MARFCSQCGAKLPDEAAFCPQCGRMLPLEIKAPPGAAVTISDAMPTENAALLQKTSQPARRPAAMRAEKKTETPPEKPVPASWKKPGSRRLSFFLAFVMIVELAVAGFKYPGFLVEKPIDPSAFWISTPTVAARQNPTAALARPTQAPAPAATDKPAAAATAAPDNEGVDPAQMAAVLASVGITEDMLTQAGGFTGEVTPENSPDNPRFIAVRFTPEEYAAAPMATRAVSQEEPEATFEEFGIHVNLKSYNLRNAADVLIVRQLPAKTDPSYGHNLYTYDFSLASGQHTFPCEVEITLPIQGEAEGLRNVLWYDEETGEWDEVFYHRAEDGKTCTALIDHFTGVGTEEMSTAQLREQGSKLIDIFEHGSVFVEGAGGDRSNRMTTGVCLVDTPDFEKIARQATRTAQGVFSVLRAGGGVPTSAGLTESLDLFGTGMDVISTGVTVGQGLKLLSDGGLVGNLLGGAFAMVGTIVLNLRLIDMTLRGASPKKVVEENRLALFSTGVSAIGSLASLAGMTTVGTVCSWICVGVFAGTLCHVIFQKSVDGNLPFSYPETLEQNAHSYYAQTVGLPVDVLRGLGVNTVANLYGDGTGWADALNELLQNNKGVLKAEELGEKVLALYKTYAGYFWTLPLEEQQDIWYNALDYLDRYPIFWQEVKSPDKMQQEEIQRFWQARALLSLGTKEDVLLQYCRLQQMDGDRIERAKSWVMDGIARQTNKIVYDLIDKEFHENVKDARRLLREEVLPLMNSTLLFYADDTSLNRDDPIEKSRYYGYNPVTLESDPKKVSKMDFICDKKALFTSANVPTPWWTIAFQPRHGTTDLVRCNVYYYLQYGAPQFVRITPPEDSDLQEVTGEVILEAAIPYTNGEEQGWRVPVVFDGRGEQLDVPVVDAKLRVYIEDGLLEYDAEEIVDTMGVKAEEKLLPKNISAVIMGDGTAAFNLPEIRDFCYKPASGGKDYLLNRPKLTVTGMVVETEDGEDREYGPYVHYKGILTGSYGFSANWMDRGNGSQSSQTTTVSNTAAYQRTGKTELFNKFDLFYFPQDGHCEMLLIFVGDIETDMVWRKDGSVTKDKDEPGYYEIQLTSLETRVADLSGMGSWK